MRSIGLGNKIICCDYNAVVESTLYFLQAIHSRGLGKHVIRFLTWNAANHSEGLLLLAGVMVQPRVALHIEVV